MDVMERRYALHPAVRAAIAIRSAAANPQPRPTPGNTDLALTCGDLQLTTAPSNTIANRWAVEVLSASGFDGLETLRDDEKTSRKKRQPMETFVVAVFLIPPGNRR